MSNDRTTDRRTRGDLLVVGLSHKSAPVEVRERFGASGEELGPVLDALKAKPSVREAMFVSTCNRVEVYVATREPGAEAATHDIIDVLCAHVGERSNDAIRGYLYERSGLDAVRHVFRVTSSLDSLVIGEPQILGQMKEAFESAKGAGALDSYLGRCVSRAFSVAKRVRTETAIGSGFVSVSSVAVDLAKKIFGDLGHSTVLLVGAGDMAEAAAKTLGRSAQSIRVCNRSFERAAKLAAQFGGSAAPLDQLEQELMVSDVVVASTGSRNFVITHDMVKRVMKARKGRTLFFVDISVPRNVDPDIHKIDNCYVFNVDDLEAQVREGLKARTSEVDLADAIIDEEVGEFRTWLRGLDVQPTVVALRAKTKSILVAELERTLNARLKHLGEGDRAALLQMLESATNKLLHAPTTKLKASASAQSNAGDADLVNAARALFDLHEPAQPPAGGSSSDVSDDHEDADAQKPSVH